MRFFKRGGLALGLAGMMTALQGCSPKETATALLVLLALILPGCGEDALQEVNAQATGDWSVTGNAGIVAPTNFLGTTDAADLVFRANNTEVMRIESGGNLNLVTGTVIEINGNRWIHATGATNNVYIGDEAGNLAAGGGANTGVGSGVLQSTTGGNNTAMGNNAMFDNTSGDLNVAIGSRALINNVAGDENVAVGVDALGSTTGSGNTAVGREAMNTNTTGSNNTTIGNDSDVSSGALTNATAIGFNAVVDASNKVRIGNNSVTVIEGQVDFTFTSDANQKENHLSVDPQFTLEKLSRIPVTSWNYIGQDPQQLRHYGPTAQDFYAAFGHDGMGTIGSTTTLTGSDVDGVLILSVQALYDLNLQKDERIEQLEGEVETLKSQLDALLQRVEQLEAASDG